jgi:hypothetical protein
VTVIDTHDAAASVPWYCPMLLKLLQSPRARVAPREGCSAEENIEGPKVYVLPRTRSPYIDVRFPFPKGF